MVLEDCGLVGFVAVVVNTALLANVHFFLVTFLGRGTGSGCQQQRPAGFSAFMGSYGR